MRSRLVRVRLRPTTVAAIAAIAAQRWTSLARLCREALAEQLASAEPVRLGRVPMPPGVDIVVPLPPAVWAEAKRVADVADVSIGQLCRLAAEAHVQARPIARRMAS